MHLHYTIYLISKNVSFCHLSGHNTTCIPRYHKAYVRSKNDDALRATWLKLSTILWYHQIYYWRKNASNWRKECHNTNHDINKHKFCQVKNQSAFVHLWNDLLETVDRFFGLLLLELNSNKSVYINMYTSNAHLCTCNTDVCNYQW